MWIVPDKRKDAICNISITEVDSFRIMNKVHSRLGGIRSQQLSAAIISVGWHLKEKQCLRVCLKLMYLYFDFIVNIIFKVLTLQITLLLEYVPLESFYDVRHMLQKRRSMLVIAVTSVWCTVVTLQSSDSAVEQVFIYTQLVQQWTRATSSWTATCHSTLAVLPGAVINAETHFIVWWHLT